MSIKSSYMENMSVRTPQSQISKSTALSSRSTSSSKQALFAQPQNWLKYRVRKQYESAQRPLPNEEEVQEDQSKKQHVPFPFLSAFIERRTGQRFTKRVKFDPTASN